MIGRMKLLVINNRSQLHCFCIDINERLLRDYGLNSALLTPMTQHWLHNSTGLIVQGLAFCTITFSCGKGGVKCYHIRKWTPTLTHFLHSCKEMDACGDSVPLCDRGVIFCKICTACFICLPIIRELSLGTPAPLYWARFMASGMAIVQRSWHSWHRATTVHSRTPTLIPPVVWDDSEWVGDGIVLCAVVIFDFITVPRGCNQPE